MNCSYSSVSSSIPIHSHFNRSAWRIQDDSWKGGESVNDWKRGWAVKNYIISEKVFRSLSGLYRTNDKEGKESKRFSDLCLGLRIYCSSACGWRGVVTGCPDILFYIFPGGFSTYKKQKQTKNTSSHFTHLLSCTHIIICLLGRSRANLRIFIDIPNDDPLAGWLVAFAITQEPQIFIIAPSSHNQPLHLIN